MKYAKNYLNILTRFAGFIRSNPIAYFSVVYNSSFLLIWNRIVKKPENQSYHLLTKPGLEFNMGIKSISQKQTPEYTYYINSFHGPN
jgi:hypothetical protein